MKVCVIGCGGIGSYFAQHIDRLIELDQIRDNFDFFDDDIVELKNILYQNFDTGDIDSTKVEALALKFFNINFQEKRIEGQDLKSYELVILCADNNKIRRDTYDVYKNYQIPFIDSRANGRAIGIYSSDTENYLGTIDKSDKPTSCQNPFQIERKEIEYGNVTVAAILAQATLAYCRTGRLPSDLMILI